MTGQIFEMQLAANLEYKGKDYGVSIDRVSNQIMYTYGGDKFFNIGLFTSNNQGSQRQSVWWNKYGKKVDKY